MGHLLPERNRVRSGMFGRGSHRKGASLVAHHGPILETDLLFSPGDGGSHSRRQDHDRGPDRKAIEAVDVTNQTTSAWFGRATARRNVVVSLIKTTI